MNFHYIFLFGKILLSERNEAKMKFLGKSEITDVKKKNSFQIFSDYKKLFSIMNRAIDPTKRYSTHPIITNQII